jgi:transcriptional regulator with XRE-family HTH domain
MNPTPPSLPSTSARAGLVPRGDFAALLRDWRLRRRVSQMELALDAGVSARHLSFLETGRARPSAGMLIALAERLDVPLRERNQWLVAAGLAPRYSEESLDSGRMAAVRSTLQRLLDAHQPYPGLVLDRCWNVVQTNPAAAGLAAALPESLRAPVLNVFRASLHPQGIAAMTHNFGEWAHYLLETLHRNVLLSGDPVLAAIEREVQGYPNVRALLDAGPAPLAAEARLLVPCILDLPAGRVSMFTTLTTFGTPRDVTLDELCVELFYPADRESERILRG